MYRNALPTWIASAAVGIILVSTGPAAADVPPPGMEVCENKKPGTRCKVSGEGAGTCQDTTCERLRYNCEGVEGWEGSGPCGTVSYPCFSCVVEPGSDDGGCGAARTSGRGFAAAGVAGLMALLWRRQRRRLVK